MWGKPVLWGLTGKSALGRLFIPAPTTQLSALFRRLHPYRRTSSRVFDIPFRLESESPFTAKVAKDAKVVGRLDDGDIEVLAGEGARRRASRTKKKRWCGAVDIGGEAPYRGKSGQHRHGGAHVRSAAVRFFLHPRLRLTSD